MEWVPPHTYSSPSQSSYETLEVPPILLTYSLTFIESNLNYKEGSTILLTINTFNIYSVQYVGSRRKLTFREG
jgi:hypothetical protein